MKTQTTISLGSSNKASDIIQAAIEAKFQTLTDEHTSYSFDRLLLVEWSFEKDASTRKHREFAHANRIVIPWRAMDQSPETNAGYLTIEGGELKFIKQNGIYVRQYPEEYEETSKYLITWLNITTLVYDYELLGVGCIVQQFNRV